MLSHSIKLQAAAGLAATALVSGLIAQTSRAAFSSTTTEAGSWDSGKVVLGENAATSVAFTDATSMVPGDTDAACVTVAFTGDVASNVRLHAATTGTLGTYLDLAVEQVTVTDADANGAIDAAECASATVVAGGSLATTTVAAFDTARSSFTDGLDTLAAGAAWAPSATESKTYRLTVELQDTNAAQDQAGTATFTWEAQNT